MKNYLTYILVCCATCSCNNSSNTSHIRSISFIDSLWRESKVTKQNCDSSIFVALTDVEARKGIMQEVIDNVHITQNRDDLVKKLGTDDKCKFLRGAYFNYTLLKGKEQENIRLLENEKSLLYVFELGYSGPSVLLLLFNESSELESLYIAKAM